MPIRVLMEQAAPVVQALKPCMMMSPLSVSQFLPPSLRFDLVIFDEASQVQPADAINCIYRGRQLIVAGDQKQLPPTPFFDRLDNDSTDEWDDDQSDKFESVLDTAKGAGLRSLALRWHYRSQHEDLITYSNYSFYAGQLVTFPSPKTDGEDTGLQIFVVPGIYRRGAARDNPVEAAKVVERIIFHRRQHPSLSIGVVAFSEAQAIENEIRRHADGAPELGVMLDGDRLNGGFVKNLETVQGHDRAIIIFSIGYGRDEAGRFTMNFGPLNKIGGQRRLNVAITRARRRVEVVSSIQSSDFSDDVRSDGVRHLRRYLDFAGRPDGRLAALSMPVSPEGRDSESPFEEEVARVIRAWGYDVVRQVGCTDYRIDLAVRHPSKPGEYCLAVECDGAMYHSSRVARDRDRLRQEVLERLGWSHIHRIWGLSWYWSRGQEEARLRRSIERSLAGRPDSKVKVQPAITEEITIELDAVPEWVTPYRVVRPKKPRVADPMHDAGAQGDLQRMILEVVEGEAPVATETVLKRVREAWGMNRAGSRARGAFDTAVRSLVRRGQIETEATDFLTLSGDRPDAVRGGDPDDPDTLRGVQEIAPSELRCAIVKFVEEVHALAKTN
jgi:very-short-patch-repair endonuclease